MPTSTTPMNDEPAQGLLPALIVTFGTTRNKMRPLDKPLTLLGRGPAADINLDDAEVSPMHCLIGRTMEGLMLRDCGSRSGSLVNGRPMREGVLKDGDELQVGPFSFRVSIPADELASPANTAPNPSVVSNEADGKQVAQLTSALDQLTRERDGLIAAKTSLEDEVRVAKQHSRALEEELKEADKKLQEMPPPPARDDRTMLNAEDIQRLRDEISSGQIEPLRKENETLRKQLNELLEQIDDQKEKLETQSAGLREIESLRSKLRGAEQAIAQLQAARENNEAEKFRAEAEQLRAEVERLEKVRAEQQHLIETQSPAANSPELLDYEKQLNEFRDQLEQAQNEIQKQEEELQARSKKNELQLSNERAELGRERGQLERLRQELQAALEHAERDTEIKKKLRGVHQLTDEVRRQMPGAQPVEEPADSISAKIRRFLKRP